MRGFTQALRFVSGASTGRTHAHRRPHLLLPSAHGAIVADEYLPAVGAPRGTVVFVHGMSLRGHRDPRQVIACRALADSGLRVVAPLLPAVAAARIHPVSVERIVAVVHRVSEQLEAPVGLFSASFSGGLSLRAALRPELLGRISAACVIGAYTDLHSCLRHVMSAPSADPYGRLVVLRTLLPRLLGPCAEVEELLDEAIADDSLQRDPPRLPLALVLARSTERELVERILRDPEWCAARVDDLLAASADLVEQLDVLPHAGRLRVPVALVHGRGDDVIPPSQSQLLHSRLQALGGRSRLAITPLLTHGDQQWRLSTASSAIALLRTVAWFMERVPGAPPRVRHRPRRGWGQAAPV